MEALAEEFIELNGTERAQGMPNSPQAFQHAYNRLMQLHVHSDYMNREWFREFDPNGRKMILVISAGQLQCKLSFSSAATGRVGCFSL